MNLALSLVTLSVKHCITLAGLCPTTEVPGSPIFSPILQIFAWSFIISTHICIQVFEFLLLRKSWRVHVSCSAFFIEPYMQAANYGVLKNWEVLPPWPGGHFPRTRHLLQVEFDRRRQGICRSWNSLWMRTLSTAFRCISTLIRGLSLLC